MRVYFIGAGPGAADLITVRGARLLSECPLVLYAGSLVPPALLQYCRADATLINTAALTLDEQEAWFLNAQRENRDIARLHTGDPALYGAIAEQMQRLRRHGIDYEIVPGVSSFLAAAAALAVELTQPEIAQTVIITRAAGRTPMPPNEQLAALAQHRATLCLFLSGRQLADVIGELKPIYGDATPVALVHKASQPEQRIVRGTLADILERAAGGDWSLTTLILVGEALGAGAVSESRLYAGDFTHGQRG